MAKVLVSGAGGFVGKFLLPLLAEQGFTVHALLRAGAERPAGAHFFHEADLLAPERARRLVEEVRPSHLVHLAWCTGPSTYLDSPENRLWVAASLELAQAFAEAGGSRAVFTGSCYEYGKSESPCSEAQTPLMPENLYGECKKELFHKLTGTLAQSPASFCWVRPFFLFGPGGKPGRLLPLVARSVLAGEKTPPVLGALIRDYLYVEDAALAFALLLSSEIAGPVNLASGSGVSLYLLVRALCSLLGREELIRWAEDRQGRYAPSIVADIGRLRDEAGFRPRFSLDQGLAATARWCREHPETR